MLTAYNLKMPHAVFGGENAMDNITTILKTNNVKRVAMFTDKGIRACGLFALPEVFKGMEEKAVAISGEKIGSIYPELRNVPAADPVILVSEITVSSDLSKTRIGVLPSSTSPIFGVPSSSRSPPFCLKCRSAYPF